MLAILKFAPVSLNYKPKHISMYGTYIPKGYPQTYRQIQREKQSRLDPRKLTAAFALISVLLIAFSY